MSEPLLDVELTSSYENSGAVLDRVRFSISEGEILGLAGDSGSGKSTMAVSLLRLLHLRGGIQSGWLRFEGVDLMPLSERDLRQIRGRRIGFVPQSPAAALNPLLTLRAHLNEAWRAHSQNKVASFREILESVTLPSDDEFLARYPAQISVGQGQRFLIAMSLLHNPSLLIADEPTSSLDVITQAEILALFRKINKERNTAMLFISHDLRSVAALCDRIAILNQGQIVESGPTDDVFANPQHPYTQRLVAAASLGLSHFRIGKG